MAQVVEYLVVVLALIGAYLSARTIRAGFHIWFVANLLGCLFFYSKELYGMMILYGIFAALNIYGLNCWRKVP